MKISVAIDIDALVRQLSPQQKIRLARQLGQEAWAAELDAVVNRIRNRPSVRRVSNRDITRIVEEARKARNLRASRRS